jgi:hypothetical protein
MNGEMVSARKILWHRDKVASYLGGGFIFPVTLELGLTTSCNRSCSDCPSRRGRPGLFLSLETARRLFALCRGRTFGAILTGGEPTLHPDLGPILASARENGFHDVVVISNGSRMDLKKVSEPLLLHASAVRVSLYDWRENASGPSPTLKRIARLRAQIEKTGSGLRIGTSFLTGETQPAGLKRVAAEVRAAGAHWLYFHPTCVAASGGTRRERGQEDLWAALEACRLDQPPDFAVHYLVQRFSAESLVFSGYHAAHFIMVVGADGGNYLSSETKYQSPFLIGSEAGYADDGYFRRSARSDRIASFHSHDYPAGGSRNRGVIYNHVLEQARLDLAGMGLPDVQEFLLPHIL